MSSIFCPTSKMQRDLHVRTNVAWARQVRFYFDGNAVTAYDGENLAAALFATGHRALRTCQDDGGSRGAFCFMGVCQECVVVIDGRLIEACRVPVSEGLVVEIAR